MARCLAEALLADADRFARGFGRLPVRWYRDGHDSVPGRSFGVGHATRTAIEGIEATDGKWHGNTHPDTAGNGSLVRVAPVAIRERESLRAAWPCAASQSRITHGSLEVVSCCQLLAMQLHRALRGASREAVLAPKMASLPPRVRIVNAGE